MAAAIHHHGIRASNGETMSTFWVLVTRIFHRKSKGRALAYTLLETRASVENTEISTATSASILTRPLPPASKSALASALASASESIASFDAHEEANEEANEANASSEAQVNEPVKGVEETAFSHDSLTRPSPDEEFEALKRCVQIEEMSLLEIEEHRTWQIYKETSFAQE